MLFLLLLGGAIFMTLWVMVGVAAKGSSIGSAPWEVWRSIIAGQGVLWAASLWVGRYDLFWAFRRHLAASCYCAVVFVALMLASVAPRAYPGLMSAYPKLALLPPKLATFAEVYTLIGAMVGALLATTIGVGLVELRRDKPTFALLTELRTRFRRCATTMSVILIAAVTSAAWLSKALETREPHAFPKELVFSYGIYFTAVMLMVYLPASAQFYRAATWLADRQYPMVSFDKAQSELRAALLTEVGITPGDALQGVLATLSPIVSAILAHATSQP